MKHLLHDFEIIIFDIDGTLISGDQVLPGSIEFIKQLRDLQKKILLVTNNPMETKQMICTRLMRMGLLFEEHELVTPLDAITHFLKSSHQPIRIFSLANAAVTEELNKRGIAIYSSRDDSIHYSHVLVGMNHELTYAQLMIGLQIIDQGAELVGLNSDPFCPTEFGRKPDTGSIIALLETASGQKGVHIGKPTQWMQMAIQSQINTSPEKCLFIGDSPFTDIKIGQEMGMKTILIRSNAFSAVIEGLPTYIYPNLTPLLNQQLKEEV